MNLNRTPMAVLTAAGIGAMGLLGAASPAQASVVDLQQARCGNALVTAKLERDSSEYEVDIEVYSDKRGERWTMVIADASGDVLRQVSRKTNREGEFDVWRSIPGTVSQVEVDVRGPNGQRCTLQLRA